MSQFSRRRLLTTGLVATAGVSGLAAAAKVAERYGLIPPDGGGLYGPRRNADVCDTAAIDLPLFGA
jgi:hypothetical protein